MTDPKTRYSEFCQNGYVPLHLQPWWLDAVCGPEHWDVVLSADKRGRINGAFPYYTRRRWGIKGVQLPPLTTYGGAWLHYPQEADFKSVSRLSFEHKVMDALIAQLPRVLFLKLNFRPEISNWLPFYWKGFRQTTRYTYIFQDTTDLEKITAGFRNTLRSDLKKAAKRSEYHREDAAWEAVFAMNRRSFERKSLRQPYSFEVFEKLHHALQSRGQSVTFLARDRLSARPSAGLYLVFDERQASVLLTGTEPEFKNQGAIYLLFLEAIRFCAQRKISLDFEGSMDPKIERSFRAFGANLTPYFQVWRMG